MAGPEHPIHFATQTDRIKLVRSLADIMVCNRESSGVAALPPRTDEDDTPPQDILDELPGTITVLAGEVPICDDHPWNSFILTSAATPTPSDPNDVEYTLRTRMLKSAPESAYGNATFRVCMHQGYFRPAEHDAEYTMLTATYRHVGKLLIGGTFDSEIRTRRALKQLTEEGVIDHVIHKPRINWSTALFRLMRYYGMLPPQDS